MRSCLIDLAAFPLGIRTHTSGRFERSLSPLSSIVTSSRRSSVSLSLSCLPRCFSSGHFALRISGSIDPGSERSARSDDAHILSVAPDGVSIGCGQGQAGYEAGGESDHSKLQNRPLVNKAGSKLQWGEGVTTRAVWRVVHRRRFLWRKTHIGAWDTSLVTH